MDALKLPDNVEALQALVLKQQKQIEKARHRINTLEEYFRQQNRERFGPSSEASYGQGDLFDEAEQVCEQLESTPTQISEPKNKAPRKRGRRALPKDLPRVELIHDLSESEKQCECGQPLKPIGTQESEQLDIVPMKIQVLHHICKKYACPCCQDKVVTAEMPAQPIPKSNASAG